jgi:CO/xanthine dehydrogenase Mo-binding subunit
MDKQRNRRAMCIGQALCEQVVFDYSGKKMNPSFVDYLMPTINMCRASKPRSSAATRLRPLCAKGTGEIACVPPMACIANAIFNATGVRINKLPLSPENVLRRLKEAGKA